MLRQMESKEYVVNGMTCHITPFPAFKAAKLSGDLAKFIAPLASVFVPLIEKAKNGEIKDIDENEALSLLPECLKDFSGDDLEKLLRTLLIGGNVVVEIPDEDGEVEARKLTQDVADEVFCGNLQGMYQLAYYVVKLNFGGFFEKLPTQFGEVKLDRKKRKKL